MNKRLLHDSDCLIFVDEFIDNIRDDDDCLSDIDFLDLKSLNLQYSTSLDHAFNRTLQSGWFIFGDESF